MALTSELVDEIFTPHHLNEEQLDDVNDIQTAAKYLAKLILSLTPSGPSQTAAIRKVKEASMTAVFGITMDGKF